MPYWADVTNDGFEQVAEPTLAGAEVEPLGVALPDRLAPARAGDFGMTAICGLAATCGIAAAALPAPPPTVTFLTVACRALLAAGVPRKLAVATPPPTSTAQVATTPMIAPRESRVTGPRRNPGSRPVSASRLAEICRTRRDATHANPPQHGKCGM
jgi:hypothetical protein